MVGLIFLAIFVLLFSSVNLGEGRVGKAAYGLGVGLFGALLFGMIGGVTGGKIGGIVFWIGIRKFCRVDWCF